MYNAHQRGALCAHGELRNCLYQRQFVSDTRRKSCLQKNFDEVAHERYARSTAGGTLHWCRQEGGAAKLRRKGCLVINSLQKASLLYAYLLSITDTSRVALRSMPQFAAHAAFR